MILGILCGFLAAFCQCVSYIFSKKYVHKDGNSFQLLIASHLIMGGFAAICLIVLLLDNDLPPFKDYWLALLKVDGFYLLAQLSFFLAISKTEASRLAPLLGLKIIFIAILGLIFWKQSLDGLQWLAVFVCLAGAVMSNWSGKSIPLAGIVWLLGAVVGYSLSDISIKELIDCVQTENGKGVFSILVAASVSYFYLGIFSLVVMLFTKKVKLKHFKPAICFSCFWFAAMLLLFACFGLIGPLFGNLVQAGRGIMAVILGVVVANLGWSEHEEKISTKLLILRIIAAMLVTGSIILFAVAKYCKQV